MDSGQGVLWIILWICLNSELLRYHGVQNFAKNDTENAELADAQTAAFSVSTQKPVHQESLRSFSGETAAENFYEKHSSFEPSFFRLSIPVLYTE